MALQVTLTYSLCHVSPQPNMWYYYSFDETFPGHITQIILWAKLTAYWELHVCIWNHRTSLLRCDMRTKFSVVKGSHDCVAFIEVQQKKSADRRQNVPRKLWSSVKSLEFGIRRQYNSKAVTQQCFKMSNCHTHGNPLLSCQAHWSEQRHLKHKPDTSIATTQYRLGKPCQWGPAIVLVPPATVSRHPLAKALWTWPTYIQCSENERSHNATVGMANRFHCGIYNRLSTYL